MHTAFFHSIVEVSLFLEILRLLLCWHFGRGSGNFSGKINGAQGVLVLIDYIDHQQRLDVYISGEIFP